MFNVSSTCTLGLSCSIILVQWLLTLNKSPFQYVSLGYCVFTSFYINVLLFCILLVWIVRCAARCALMTLWWVLTCIIVFYCVCISKVSSNLQCVLVYDTIFYFNLVCLLSLILLVLYYIWYCYFYSPVAFASYCSKHMCDCV